MNVVKFSPVTQNDPNLVQNTPIKERNIKPNTKYKCQILRMTSHSNKQIAFQSNLCIGTVTGSKQEMQLHCIPEVLQPEIRKVEINNVIQATFKDSEAMGEQFISGSPTKPRRRHSHTKRTDLLKKYIQLKQEQQRLCKDHTQPLQSKNVQSTEFISNKLSSQLSLPQGKETAQNLRFQPESQNLAPAPPTKTSIPRNRPNPRLKSQPHSSEIADRVYQSSTGEGIPAENADLLQTATCTNFIEAEMQLKSPELTGTHWKLSSSCQLFERQLGPASKGLDDRHRDFKSSYREFRPMFRFISTFFILLIFFATCWGEDLTEDQLSHFRRERSAMAKKWAPLIFLHPDERYFPSAVHSFLENVVPREVPPNERPKDPTIIVPMSRSLNTRALPEGIDSMDTYLFAPIDPKCRNCPLPDFLHGNKPTDEYSPPVYATITSCLPTSKPFRHPRHIHSTSRNPRSRRLRFRRRGGSFSLKPRSSPPSPHIMRRSQRTIPYRDSNTSTPPFSTFTNRRGPYESSPFSETHKIDSFNSLYNENESKYSSKMMESHPTISLPSTELLPPISRVFPSSLSKERSNGAVQMVSTSGYLDESSPNIVRNEHSAFTSREPRTEYSSREPIGLVDYSYGTSRKPRIDYSNGASRQPQVVYSDRATKESGIRYSDTTSSKPLEEKISKRRTSPTRSREPREVIIITSEDSTQNYTTISDPTFEDSNKSVTNIPDSHVATSISHEVMINTNTIPKEKPIKLTGHKFTVTYWMFYPFSQGKEVCTSRIWILGRVFKPRVRNKCYGDAVTLNSHVGDWEHVSIYFEDSVPQRMYVSTHTYGAFYHYDARENLFRYRGKDTRLGLPLNPKYPPVIKMDGSHPVLYAARGSHGLWGGPGIHRYESLVPLEDKAAAGTRWRAWDNIDIIDYRDSDFDRPDRQWMQFHGRWGNPASGCHKALFGTCDLASGPTGIPLKRENFPCHLPQHPTFFPKN